MYFDLLDLLDFVCVAIAYLLTRLKEMTIIHACLWQMSLMMSACYKSTVTYLVRVEMLVFPVGYIERKVSFSAGMYM